MAGWYLSGATKKNLQDRVRRRRCILPCSTLINFVRDPASLPQYFEVDDWLKSRSSINNARQSLNIWHIFKILSRNLELRTVLLYTAYQWTPQTSKMKLILYELDVFSFYILHTSVKNILSVSTCRTLSQSAIPSGTVTFLTVTCNPLWREISVAYFPERHIRDRRNIFARIFCIKLRKIMAYITKESVLGEAEPHSCDTEFQKHGVHHAHCIFFLCESWMLHLFNWMLWALLFYETFNLKERITLWYYHKAWHA